MPVDMSGQSIQPKSFKQPRGSVYLVSSFALHVVVTAAYLLLKRRKIQPTLAWQNISEKPAALDLQATQAFSG
jgi:hypothetical protein